MKESAGQFGFLRSGVWLLVGLLLVLLAGCAQDTRAVPSPEEAHAYAAQVGGPNQPAARKFAWQDVKRVQAMSFCYSAVVNSPIDVTAVAKETCKGGQLRIYAQDTYIRACPLLQPVRITFICYPPVLSGAQP